MMSQKRKLRSTAVALLALFVICGARAGAQNGAEQDEVVSVNTSLVRVSVTATNTRRHRAVALDASSLKLFADGREQQIAFIQREEAPTTVAFLVDVSDSMRGASAERTR